MAARSRPRGGQLKDEFDEERSLWNQIRADARRIDQLMASYISISNNVFFASSFFSLWSISKQHPRYKYIMSPPPDLVKEIENSSGFQGSPASKTRRQSRRPKEEEIALWKQIREAGTKIDRMMVCR
jgi:hypothetical protein